MADPPWDIHMELPYGTMSDDEMRHLPVQKLQDEGLIFLWVTGRAMELGRECLKIWGYERVDEIIWVKTNQLQRIIRTGRTGHWLNHGKEHCLVGLKGKCIGYFFSYRTRAIISRGLYIFYPIFKDHFFVLRRFFQKILSLCMACIQEWLVIKSGL